MCVINSTRALQGESISKSIRCIFLFWSNVSQISRFEYQCLSARPATVEPGYQSSLLCMNLRPTGIERKNMHPMDFYVLFYCEASVGLVRHISWSLLVSQIWAIHLNLREAGDIKESLPYIRTRSDPAWKWCRAANFRRQSLPLPCTGIISQRRTTYQQDLSPPGRKTLVTNATPRAGYRQPLMKVVINHSYF